MIGSILATIGRISLTFVIWLPLAAVMIKNAGEALAENHDNIWRYKYIDPAVWERQDGFITWGSIILLILIAYGIWFFVNEFLGSKK